MNAEDSYDHLLRDFERAVRVVFDGTDTVGQVESLTAEYRRDRDHLERNRGLSLPTIGFFGLKNHGKSTLLRALISDPAVRDRIRAGVGPEARTEKVTWVGEARPTDFDPAWEEWIPVEAATGTSLGARAVLVDVPGLNDPHEGAGRAAERAKHSCQIKVFVVTYDQVEDHTVAAEIQHLDGHDIVPVVNRLPWSVTDPKSRAQAAVLFASMSKAAPKAQIHDPILLTDINFAKLEHGTEDGDLVGIQRELTGRLITLIEEVRTRPSLLPTQISRRFQKLRRDLRGERGRLGEFLASTQSAWSELEDLTSSFPEDVIKAVEGSPRSQASAVLLGIRAEMLRRTSGIHFPYRSIIGLLCLTTGAWDKLAQAFSGSVPSLAMLAAQSIRNVRDLGQRFRWEKIVEGAIRTRLRFDGRGEDAKDDEEDAPSGNRLEHRIREQFRHRLRAPVEGIAFAVRRFSGRTDLALSHDVDVIGLEHLIDLSLRTFEEETARSAPKWLFNHMTGMAASVLFWGVLAGPLWAVYRQFAEVWRLTWTNAAPVTWEQYPAPQGGMLATSLLLALLPIVLLGILSLGWATRGGVTRTCAKRIAKKHREGTEILQSAGTLRIELRDRALQAAQQIRRFLESAE